MTEEELNEISTLSDVDSSESKPMTREDFKENQPVAETALVTPPAVAAEPVEVIVEKPLPRILGGICEYCGTAATNCDHTDKFAQAGII